MVRTREGTAAQPWLRNPEWRRRVIVHGRMVRGRVVALAWIFFPGPFALISVVGLIAFPERMGVEGFFIMLFVASLFSLFAMVPTYYWWRHRRYGNSQCRLLTLPGVIGGRFEADVHCALPEDEDQPVVVRLVNYRQGGEARGEVWRMEERIRVPVQPGARALVPVRLNVPRHPAQVPPPLQPGWKEKWLSGEPHFELEIAKKAKGVDFHATFVVPVYDLPPGGAPR